MSMAKSIKDAAIQSTDLYVVGTVVSQDRSGAWQRLVVRTAEGELTALLHEDKGSLPVGLKGKKVEVVGYSGNNRTLRVREVRKAGRDAGPVTEGDWRVAFVDEAAGRAHIERFPAYLD